MNTHEAIKTPSAPEGVPTATESVAKAPEKRTATNNKESAMSRLKALWLGTLSDEEKSHWREQFETRAKTLKTMREEIAAQHKIVFTYDRQMARFRDWVQEEQRLLKKAERMEEDERRLHEEFPNATKDEIRDELLKRTYARIFSEGDFRLFIRAAQTDVQIDTLQLNREKFKESLRAKIQAGLQALAAESEKNPAVKAAVEQLRQAIAPE
jgi:hypothetical protein